MRRAIRMALVLAAAAAAPALVQAASGGARTGAPVASEAHRGDGSGNYGGLKGSSPAPRRALPRDDRDRIKPPYPLRYRPGGEDRTLSGCDWLARRAIETNNRNWLARYRACTE